MTSKKDMSVIKKLEKAIEEKKSEFESENALLQDLQKRVPHLAIEIQGLVKALEIARG